MYQNFFQRSQSINRFYILIGAMILGLLATIVLLKLIHPVSAQQNAQNNTFVNSGQFLGNFSNDSVSLGDIDGDGDLDLLSDGIWENDGRGYFSKKQITGGFNFYVGQLGDVDGDGDLDAIAVVQCLDTIPIGTCFFRSLIFLRNNGKGDFTVEEIGSVIPSISRISLVDLDGDGDLDAIINYFNDFISIWENNDSAFSAVTQIEVPIVAYSLGDLDGDGDIDAFVATSTTNEVWINDGDFNFSIAFSATISTSTGIGLGDLNNDGYLDSIVTTENDNLIWQNNGNLSFTLTTTIDSNANNVSLGDIDNDGDLDSLFAYDGTNKLWLNQGNFSFTFGTKFGNNTTIGSALGDLDGDGDLDVILANEGPDEVWLQDGLPLFDEVASFGNSAGRAVALGDLDGDRDMDAYVTNNGANVVWRNDGGFNFSEAISLGNSSSYDVALGDLDNDGDLDGYVTNDGPNIIWRNDKGFNFIEAATIESHNNRSVVMGDLDGDKDLDIFEGNSVWQNDNNFLFTKTLELRYSASSIQLGDIDKDGHLDAIIGQPSHLICSGMILVCSERYPSNILLKNNDGAFSNKTQLGDLNSEASAIGDFNGNGYLDLFLSNSNQSLNQIWLNNGPFSVLGGDVLGNANIIAMDSADIDGDGDIDFSLATDDGIELWLNDGSANFTLIATIEDQSISDIALGDLDGDGNVDIFTTSLDGPNRVYKNTMGGSARFQVNLQTPGTTDEANDYFTSEIFDSIQIPITYSLYHPNSESLGYVRGYYSLDGGGNWKPAIPTSQTIVTNLESAPFPIRNSSNTHQFTWDTSKANIFGQSDNVVFRLEVFPQPFPTDITGTYKYTNTLAGPFMWPYAADYTSPFRVRGNQVRVFSETIMTGNEASGAIVYRLPSDQPIGAQPIADGSGLPFQTNSLGYLEGRGEIGIGDTLIALLPITTAAEGYTLYHTNIDPTETGIEGHSITQGGIQNIAVSAENPLILFNLDVSLEWDARNDAGFLERLESDLQRTSQILFDLSNGQVALGDINIYQDKENWLNSHLLIYANNSLRPNANLGGIVITPTTDILSQDQEVTAYYPGQVRIGAEWNRFGNSSSNIGEDWPRALAHELGHYLLYLPDNYLGIADDVLIQIDGCRSAMTDAYREDYSEFMAPGLEWDAECGQTIAAQYTDRSDWETITTFYDMLIDDRKNEGPTNFPLETTRVTFMDPPHPPETLTAPFVALTDSDNRPLPLPNGAAQGYLIKTQGTIIQTDDTIVAVGSPNADLIHARGAEPGDRFCVFDSSQRLLRVGCIDDMTVADVALQLHELPEWEPQITVQPITTDTISVTVTQPISTGDLYVQILPTYQPTHTISITSPVMLMNPVGNDTYTQTIKLEYPVFNGYVRVWVEGSDPVQETIAEFYNVSDWPAGNRYGWIAGNRYGWIAGNRYGWAAPMVSSDGQVIIFDLDHIFDGNLAATLQTLPVLPDLPSWLTPAGQGYRFTEQDDGGNRTIMFQYLERNVPGGNEDHLSLYYSPDDGHTWERLHTTLDTRLNLASAQMAGEGIYVLVTTIQMPPFAKGWNGFGYPVPGTRPVQDALASIDGRYTTLTHYDAHEDKWTIHDATVVSEHPEFAPIVNDLTDMQFGLAYWIQVTKPVTLYLGVQATNRLAAESASMPQPPATYYGWITPTSSSSPTDDLILTAWVNGNLCGESTVVEWLGGYAYKIQVASENMTGAPNGCGGNGRFVTFKLNGQPMGTSQVWDNTQAWYYPLTQTNWHSYLPLILKNP